MRFNTTFMGSLRLDREERLKIGSKEMSEQLES